MDHTFRKVEADDLSSKGSNSSGLLDKSDSLSGGDHILSREQLITAQGQDVELQKVETKQASCIVTLSPVTDCTVDKIEHVDNVDNDVSNVNLDDHNDNVSHKLRKSDVLSHCDEKLSHLSFEQKTQLSDLIHEFSHLFPVVPGRTIDVGGAVPVNNESCGK
ncbi:Hypothetical predicted protein [Octopus vulgaris]|uniref:Uncharacterized protein n=1 Tax=Octopus vulgaris TaxID=6645 RepID=A0AA36AI62_OCTVU|nr:Hypothetical predicted protein [Octopus vulgaris]